MKEITIILLLINISILLAIGNTREGENYSGINPPPQTKAPKHPGKE